MTRLVRAVRDGETIGVFGDYDVDGATSAALLTRFFAATGTPTRIYVPDRLREGYGPNTPALLRLQEEGVRVVVTEGNSPTFQVYKGDTLLHEQPATRACAWS